MKRLLSLFLALLILASVSVPAFADDPVEANGSSEEVTVLEADSITRQEETEWHFRTYLGRRQMRLWSITYGHWLTDWIDIGPAN